MANTLQACTCSSQYGRLRRDYWKLPCPKHSKGTDAKARMNELGFKFSSAVQKGRLIYLVHRAERGLLSYDKCSVAELQRFVVGRRLAGTINTSSSKAVLVRQLEHADDQLSFDPFMQLTPELRSAIYKFHFSSFETVEVQPLPITQVSQLFRRESQPLFYEHTRLSLYIDSHHTLDGNLRYFAADGCYRLFQSGKPSDISQIRRLRLTLSYANLRYGRMELCRSSWDLNPYEEDGDLRIVELDTGSDLETFSDVDGGKREERLEEVLEKLGQQKLERRSLQAIARACDVEHDTGLISPQQVK